MENIVIMVQCNVIDRAREWKIEWKMFDDNAHLVKRIRRVRLEAV